MLATLIPPESAVVPLVLSEAEIAVEFSHLYTEAQKALRAVVGFGLFAWQLKTTRLKHGQFAAWLKTNCPYISYRSVRAHMQVAMGVLDACHIPTRQILAIANSLPFCSASGLLLLPDEKLPATAREAREKICGIIDGRSSRQLLLQFSQVTEQPDGSLVARRGRLPGSGGCTRLARHRAAMARNAASLESITLRSRAIAEWLIEGSDDQHLGLMDEPDRRNLLRALEISAAYLRSRLHVGGDVRRL